MHQPTQDNIQFDLYFCHQLNTKKNVGVEKRGNGKMYVEPKFPYILSVVEFINENHSQTRCTYCYCFWCILALQCFERKVDIMFMVFHERKYRKKSIQTDGTAQYDKEYGPQVDNLGISRYLLNFKIIVLRFLGLTCAPMTHFSHFPIRLSFCWFCE
jgi:hypothetical protein